MRTEIILGNLLCLVKNQDVVSILSEHMRIENDFRQRQLQESIPKYKRLISERGWFTLGLLPKVESLLGNLGIEYTITDRRRQIPLPSVDEIVDAISLLPFSLRDYQLEALLAACEGRSCIIQAATGAGKGAILAALIAAYGRPCLIPLKSITLVNQLRQELADYFGIPVREIGMIGGGKFKPAEITVGVVNTLRMPKCAKFLKTVDIVFVDECHNALSPTYSTILNGCVNAPIRIGLSATPSGPRIKTESGGWIKSDIELIGLFGPLVCKVKTRRLVEDGWLAEPFVKFIENRIDFQGNIMAYAREYKRIITKSRFRNNKAIELVTQEHNADRVMIFVDHVDHGRNLYDQLHALGVDVVFANGQNVSNNRDTALRDFKEGRARVLVGTSKILSEGLNFQCDVAINMCAGRSENGVVQKIGRVLRKAKSPSGDVDPLAYESVHFYDFFDKGHPYFENQAKERFSYLQREGHSCEIIGG